MNAKLFAKVAGGQAKTMGGMLTNASSSVAAAGMTAANAASFIKNIPWYVAVPGAMVIGNAMQYGTPAQQSRPMGPTSMQANAGYYSRDSSLSDMGASGDLVFALHNLNH